MNILVSVLAVLAHAAYCRKEVQHEMLDLGGIPLVLSQCQVCSAPDISCAWGIHFICCVFCAAMAA